MNHLHARILKLVVLSGLFIGYSNARCQNLDLSYSYCAPLTCIDTAITENGSVFVQITGVCQNGLEIGKSAQLAIIVPCQLPVSLKVDAGEKHTTLLDDCGVPYVLGSVFAEGEADNGSVPTGTVYGESDCAGGTTTPSPAFNPC